MKNIEWPICFSYPFTFYFSWGNDLLIKKTMFNVMLNLICISGSRFDSVFKHIYNIINIYITNNQKQSDNATLETVMVYY